MLFRDFWDIFIKGLTKNGNFIQNFNLQFSLVVYSIYNCINVLVIILLNCVISFVVPGVSTHTFFVHVELIFSLEYIVYWKTFRFFSLLWLVFIEFNRKSNILSFLHLLLFPQCPRQPFQKFSLNKLLYQKREKGWKKAFKITLWLNSLSFDHIKYVLLRSLLTDNLNCFNLAEW